MRRESWERFPSLPQFSDPDMHHGTCVTHVPWCMPESLTSSFLWIRWRGNRSRHSRRMRNPRFCVSGKRPMQGFLLWKRDSDIFMMRSLCVNRFYVCLELITVSAIRLSIPCSPGSMHPTIHQINHPGIIRLESLVSKLARWCILTIFRTDWGYWPLSWKRMEKHLGPQIGHHDVSWPYSNDFGHALLILAQLLLSETTQI